MVNVQSGNEEATNRILATVNFTLIAPLIDDELLAENKEFLGTVEKTAVALFKQGGYLTFSDALFTAITQRQVAIAQTPVLTGMIDGQDNVIPKE